MKILNEYNQMSSQMIFRSIFMDLLKNGKEVSPRGQLIKERENFAYVLPPFVRFCNFEGRNLNIPYLKKEFLWYLRGDKFDTSIADHAKLWKSIINEDGSINSNYGQYFFGEEKQFDVVVNTLANDKDSRRAAIVLLNKYHLNSKTNDVPCTYALSFRIRGNELNMTVHMRSQDAVFGMGNDAPAFSFIHEMLLNALREFYPDLRYGNYVHFADSFHVYEKHFEMAEKIVDAVYHEVDCPPISGPDEVRFLRALDFESIPENYKFTKWLTS